MERSLTTTTTTTTGGGGDHLNKCVQVILDDLNAFDDVLWLYGPMPSDLDGLAKQLDQINAFTTTSKQLGAVIDKLVEEDRQLKQHHHQSTLINNRPVDVLSSKLEHLIATVSDRRERLQHFQRDVTDFKTAIDKTTLQLLDTERQLEHHRNGEIELAILQKQFEIHFDSVENVTKMGQQLVESKNSSKQAQEMFRQQLTNLENLFVKILQKATCDCRLVFSDNLTKRLLMKSKQLPELLAKFAKIDADLAVPQHVRPHFFEVTEQLVGLNVMVTNEIEPVLIEAKNVIDLMSGDSEQTRSELTNRVQIIEAKIEQRRSDYEKAQQLIGTFEKSYDEFCKWLRCKEPIEGSTLLNDEPITTTIKTQLDEMAKLDDDLADIKAKAGDLRHLLETGTALEFQLSRQDAVQLRRQLNDVHLRWKAIRDDKAVKLSQLSSANKMATSFFNQMKELHEWITASYAKLSSPDFDNPNQFESRGIVHVMLHRLNHLSSYIKAKEKNYTNCLDRATSLMEQSRDDHDRADIQVKVDELKRAWVSLLGAVDDKRRRLESVLIALGEFIETPETLVKWLSRTKLLLDIDTPTGGDVITVDKLLREHHMLEEQLTKRSEAIDLFRNAGISKSNSVTTSASVGSLLFSFDDTPFPHCTGGGGGGSSTSLYNETTGVVLINELDDLNKQVRGSAERRAEMLLQSKEQARQFDNLLKQMNDYYDALRTNCTTMSSKLSTIGAGSRTQLNCQLGKVKQWVRESELARLTYNEALSLGRRILDNCHPDAVLTVRRNLMLLESRWGEVVTNSLFGLQKWLEDSLARFDDNLSQLADVSTWLDEMLPHLTSSPLSAKTLLGTQIDDESQQLLLENLLNEQVQLEEQFAQQMLAYRRLPLQFQKRLEADWRRLVHLIDERHRILHDASQNRQQMERLKNFNFDEWRQRYLAWLTSKKCRPLDAFRTLDANRDGKLTQNELIDGVLRSRFPSTNRAELQLVAIYLFEQHPGGAKKATINYGDFQRAIQPSLNKCHADQVLNEVNHYLLECRCKQRFRIERMQDGRYRMGQQVFVVRMMSSTLMVRIGGGWQALDEFVRRNDPCQSAKQRSREVNVQPSISRKKK